MAKFDMTLLRKKDKNPDLFGRNSLTKTILPPSGVFINFTPSFSNLSHASYTSGTLKPICPEMKHF